MDIKDCIRNIEAYTKDLTFEKFKNNKMAVDAVVRNLEIIGEAANNLSSEIKRKSKGIEWTEIVGMRNKIIHEYFGVDLEIIWTAIREEIPKLRKEINKIKI
jgi:uncharacterized protein with HEPN domain